MTAGILAGGKSSRMGRDKALLFWKGTTFLEHILKQTREFSQVLISVADKNQLTLTSAAGEKMGTAMEQPPILVEDEKKGYGPLEGVYQLLKHAKYPWVFIAATDMPLLNQNLIKELLAVDRKAVQAVIVRENAEAETNRTMPVRIHPLCGLYHVSCIPVLEELFWKERRSMQSLLEHIRVRYITPEELHTDAKVLTNVNDQAEYLALRKMERDEGMRVAIITSSDTGAKGLREDKSGPLIQNIVEKLGAHVVSYTLLPDERKQLGTAMAKIADEGQADLILTTGGTGFSVRDCMPEATLDIVQRQVPGIPEAIRAYSMQFTGRAMLSRAMAGIRERTLIVNLPGSPKAVSETLEYIYPHLEHGIEILKGTASDCARKGSEQHE